MKWQATGTPRTKQRIYTIHSLLCFIAILTSTSALSSTSNTLLAHESGDLVTTVLARVQGGKADGDTVQQKGEFWIISEGYMTGFACKTRFVVYKMVSVPLTTSICSLKSKETTREEGKTNSTSLKEDHYMSNLGMNVCTLSRKESLSRRQKLVNFLKKKIKTIRWWDHQGNEYK